MYLPLGSLGFAACSDVLNVSHNTIHCRGLTAVCGWALGSVVAWLVTLKQVIDAELLVSPRLVYGGGCERFPASCVGVLARVSL